MTERRSPFMRRLRGAMFKMPLMIDCETFEDFIVDYLEGRLAAKQKFVFEMHLKIGRECREYLAVYKASMAVGRSVLKDEPLLPDEIPEDLISAVIDARRN